ncbi:hypothetical protein SDJN02_17025, partial [Cucurbita argyrosperma subsp. argyrosperma]
PFFQAQVADTLFSCVKSELDWIYLNFLLFFDSLCLCLRLVISMCGHLWWCKNWPSKGVRSVILTSHSIILGVVDQ